MTACCCNREQGGDGGAGFGNSGELGNECLAEQGGQKPAGASS